MTRSSTSCASQTGGSRCRPGRASPPTPSRMTARYDTAIARWFPERGEDFPQLHVRAYREGARAAYGENPHQRAAYYSKVGARTHLLVDGPPAPRQASSRSTTCSISTPARLLLAGVRDPGLRDRQAQQPLWRGDRQRRHRRLPPRPRVRPAVGAYGGVVCSTAGRPRAGGGALGPVRRGALRARLRRRRARAPRRRRTSACSRRASGAPPTASPTCARSRAGCSSRIATPPPSSAPR